MYTSDRIVIDTLNQLVAQAEQFVVELKSYSVTPGSALRRAEEVAADFHRRRRDMLDEMMLFPAGTC